MCFVFFSNFPRSLFLFTCRSRFVFVLFLSFYRILEVTFTFCLRYRLMKLTGVHSLLFSDFTCSLSLLTCNSYFIVLSYTGESRVSSYAYIHISHRCSFCKVLFSPVLFASKPIFFLVFSFFLPGSLFFPESYTCLVSGINSLSTGVHSLLFSNFTCSLCLLTCNSYYTVLSYTGKPHVPCLGYFFTSLRRVHFVFSNLNCSHFHFFIPCFPHFINYGNEEEE